MKTQPLRNQEPGLHAGDSPPEPLVAEDSAGGLGLSSPSNPFYALTFRNYRLFFIGQLISVGGTWMQMVAQQWLVYSLTHSAVWLGIVSGSSAITYVLFSFPGGAAADRYPRRTVLLVTQTVAMLLAVFLGFLDSAPFLHIQAWHVAFVAALSGAVNAYNMPAQQAFVTELVDKPSAVGNAIALNSFRFNMARFVGPLLAGLVLVKWGVAACFYVNGASFLAVIAALLLIRVPKMPAQTGRSRMREGVSYLLSAPSLLRVTALVGSASLLLWSVSTLYPILADRFHMGARGLSAMVSINGIGAAAGGFSSAVLGERVSWKILVYGGGLLFAMGVVVLSTAPVFPVVLACLCANGFFMILFAINANRRIQEVVPNNLRGRVMAIYSLVFQGLMPLGGLEIDLLAHWVGAANAIRINGGLCLAVAITISVLSYRAEPNLQHLQVGQHRKS